MWRSGFRVGIEVGSKGLHWQQAQSVGTGASTSRQPRCVLAFDGTFGEMRPNRLQVGGVSQNDCASHEVKRARAMALRLQRVIADTTDAMEVDGAALSRLWL